MEQRSIIIYTGVFDVVNVERTGDGLWLGALLGLAPNDVHQVVGDGVQLDPSFG